MKHSKLLKSKLTLGLLFFIATIGLTSMQSSPVLDPVGIWDYEVPTEQGTLEGEMTITKNDGKYDISIETTSYGTLELQEIKISGNDLTANVDLEGATIDFEFEFDGDSMKGTITTPDGELEMTAKRRKE